jgi:hypothetical protein
VTFGARVATSVALALMGSCAASPEGNAPAPAPPRAVAAALPVPGAVWRRVAEESSSALRGFALLDDGRGGTFAVVGPKPGQPLDDVLHADLRAWALEPGPSARRQPDRTLTLPASAPEVTLGSIGRRVLFAATNADDTLAFVGEYGSDGLIHGIPASLSEDERAQVVVPPGREWSTRTLPCREWLFSPRVQDVELGGAPVVTFGTADAHVAVFRYERSRGRVEPLALLPHAVDALLLAPPAGGGARVYHRAPDARWSGYQDSQLAWSRGAVPLPLRVLEIDSSGTVARPAGVVHPSIGDTPVLAFDAVRSPDGALVIAVVRGDVHHPTVATFRIDESGGATPFPPFELGGMPVAIRLAVTGAAVFAAVLTRQGFVRTAEAYSIPLR